jgi:hypothetical protein
MSAIMFKTKEKGVVKHSRTTISLKHKLKIIGKLEKGISAAKVCQEYGTAKQIVYGIHMSNKKNR